MKNKVYEKVTRNPFVNYFQKGFRQLLSFFSGHNLFREQDKETHKANRRKQHQETNGCYSSACNRWSSLDLVSVGICLYLSLDLFRRLLCH